MISFFDAMPHPLLIKDEALKIVFANNKAIQLYAPIQKELLGKTDFDLYPEDTASLLEQNSREVFSSNSNSDTDTIEKIISTDNQIKNYQFKKHIYEYTNKKTYLVETIEEVSGETFITQENKMWSRILIDTAQEPIWVVNKNYECILINDKVKHLMLSSFSLEMKLGMNLLEADLFSNESIEKRKIWYDKALAGTTHVQYIQNTTNKGTEIYHKLNFKPAKNEEGKIIGCVIYATDITEFKESEIELEKREGLYRMLFENAFDGIVVSDVNKMKNIACSQRVIDYLGLENKDAILNGHLLNFSPEHQANGQRSKDIIEQMMGLLIQKGHVRHDWIHLHSDGSELESELYLYNFQNGKDNLIVSMIKDMTKHKIAEKVILEKNEVLQKYIDSNLQLENFTYFASHDLREPLRTITSFTQLIQKKHVQHLDSTALEYLGYIVKGVQRMNNLVEGLLTFSRVESNSQNMNDIDTLQLLTELKNDLLKSIKDNDAEISFKNLPETLHANKLTINLLFQNLISNALKFSAADRPSVITIEANEIPKFWQFAVSDNGIGIEEEYFDKVFVLFQKLHSHQKYSGTGIGLALCKKIVAQHKGEIWVTSKKGEGTTFHFTIEKVKS